MAVLSVLVGAGVCCMASDLSYISGIPTHIKIFI
jgi:hypothetical protein